MFENIDLETCPRNPPKCVECGSPTRISTSDVAYPDEPELHGQAIWLCECGAFGRCHKDSLLPASRPAGAETRAARKRAYDTFHITAKRLPRRKIGKRVKTGFNQALYVAARAAGVKMKHLRFGWLDLKTCNAVTEALEAAE